MQNHVFVSKRPVVILQNHVFNPKGTFTTCETLFHFQNTLLHPCKTLFQFQNPLLQPATAVFKTVSPFRTLSAEPTAYQRQAVSKAVGAVLFVPLQIKHIVLVVEDDFEVAEEIVAEQDVAINK